jgi:hypothetical protein
MSEQTPFDPREKLRDLTRKDRFGKTTHNDYLDVKWRVVWVRDQYPGAKITTRMERLDLERDIAVVHAHVVLPSGAEASGFGSESKDDWKDYIEKAETKAIGRALAALGFGTQFCDDLVFTEDNPEKLVDAPVERTAPPAPKAPSQRAGKPAQTASATPTGTPEPPAKLPHVIARPALPDASGKVTPDRWIRLVHGFEQDAPDGKGVLLDVDAFLAAWKQAGKAASDLYGTLGLTPGSKPSWEQVLTAFGQYLAAPDAQPLAALIAA